MSKVDTEYFKERWEKEGKKGKEKIYVFFLSGCFGQKCECSDPRRVGDLPHQEVGDREERLEDHDGERGHEPQAQQGDHRDGH